MRERQVFLSRCPLSAGDFVSLDGAVPEPPLSRGIQMPARACVVAAALLIASGGARAEHEERSRSEAAENAGERSHARRDGPVDPRSEEAAEGGGFRPGHGRPGPDRDPPARDVGSPRLPDLGRRRTQCPFDRRVVDIAASADLAVRRSQRDLLKASLKTDNTLVRLGPGVDLDFSDLPGDWFPLIFGRCVTLTSVASFDAPPPVGAGPPPPTATPAGPGRTPHSLGPVLRYGKARDIGPGIFLHVACAQGNDGAPGFDGDGARISGFRLFGPDPGFQKTSETGIRVFRCIDVEISNMEISGWGAAAIDVGDEAGPDHASESNAPGGRIMNPDQIRIHDNFIHHNQHPDVDGHALGYGVVTGDGAWARISRNVFDFNRHAIAATARTGGYWAEQNLVLRGGGYQGNFFNTYTHSFDAHGSGCWWSSDLCGDAGIQFWILSNAWQYRKDTDIHLRGKPAIGALIDGNVFPYGQDDAIDLSTNDNVTVGPHNTYDVDTFGQYGVCDFDGDGVDDLFLATGSTWWFSSYGELPWFFLAARTERLEQVRLGYFDADQRCDVLIERDGQWLVSSGGTGPWRSLGAFGVPLAEVQFGRFDPSVRDHRPGVTLQTTHAFFRSPVGQWYVTPLSGAAWLPVASSSFPMSELRFGDFTGDGVTDVLAVVDGHWAISESAIGPWQRLNATLGDPVKDLYIANMDPDDNIDDLLRLERHVSTYSVAGVTYEHVDLTWWRSRNGIEPWQRWKTYAFEYPLDAETESVFRAFVGRFGAAPGGGTMVIDENRMGRFFSPAEVPAGGFSDWSSLYPY